MRLSVGSSFSSPFAPVSWKGRTFEPAQGNNAYVFPGIGLGAVCCRARTLPDQLFLEAARTLAKLVSQQDLDRGALYPRLTDIRKISLAIASAIVTKAHALKLARSRRPKDVRRSIEAAMYQPWH